MLQTEKVAWHTQASERLTQQTTAPCYQTFGEEGLKRLIGWNKRKKMVNPLGVPQVKGLLQESPSILTVRRSFVTDIVECLKIATAHVQSCD